MILRDRVKILILNHFVKIKFICFVNGKQDNVKNFPALIFQNKIVKMGVI